MSQISTDKFKEIKPLSNFWVKSQVNNQIIIKDSCNRFIAANALVSKTRLLLFADPCKINVKMSKTCTCIRKLNLETPGDENMSMSQTSTWEGCVLQVCPCSACKCCLVCASKCKCQERCKFDVH